MSISTKTVLTLAALSVSGIAAAAKPLPVANYAGIENRDGLVPIPVCAKADLDAGTRYIWSADQAVRAALQAGAQKGCFERLGVEYSDGTRDAVRRNGPTERIVPGTQVTVARQQLDAANYSNYWLSVMKVAQ
ncbi:hypothetical protein [Roseateles sp. MS654]|uniref:hypothetical protein n=1 Tax=Roseateles sp. MS654 TaxID=3412685 RepID=UPI003C2DD24A